MKHFGIEVSENDFLTKENYCSFSHQLQSNISLKDIYYNFDKNINYFKTLSTEEFSFPI